MEKDDRICSAAAQINRVQSDRKMIYDGAMIVNRKYKKTAGETPAALIYVYSG